MTIDIKKMFKNMLLKQFSIEHIELKAEVLNINQIPKKIKKSIEQKWSEKYLLDADYVLFIKGQIDNKMLNRLFGSINQSFGQDANLLTKGDIKTLSLTDEDPSSMESNDDSAENNISDMSDNDSKAKNQDDNSMNLSDETNKKVLGDALDEDEDGSIKMNNNQNVIQEPISNRYVFVKLTLKK